MISRVSEILRAFQGQNRSLTVSELGRQCGIPKASTSRIVAELVDVGFLERSGNSVRLGLRLFELGQQASLPTDLRKFTMPSMTELMRATGQTVHLAVLEGSDVVYIQILRSKTSPPLPSRVGGRLPAYATGVGKALLAYAHPDILDDLFSRPLVAIGPNTITSPAILLKEFDEIRQNRIAFEREESSANLGCAAAPILKADGTALAAISVSVHLALTDLARVGPAVSAVAMSLSRHSERLPANL
jgi:IclR family acetate operon transcriptional repressor